MRQFMITKIRPLALTLLAPGLGFFLLLLLELGFKIEASRLLSSVINLIIVAPVAFLLFPRVLGIPFGRVAIGVYLKKLGFFFPQNAWKHVLLGLVLAACTLSGMLIGSLLSGEYVLDVGRIELQHLVFSLNPGIWEELFYRGVMMVLPFLRMMLDTIMLLMTGTP